MNELMKYRKQLFAAEEGTIVAADMEPAISIDHNERLVTGIRSLLDVLGITQMTPMATGTTVKFYKYKKKNSPEQVGEGEEIKLTEFERKQVGTYELKLEKYRKRSTAEAIQKIGKDKAVNKTDELLEREAQKSIKSKFYAFLQTGEGVANKGETLQAALANIWAKMSTYEPFIDGDFTPIYFVNPLDIADYLATASVTLQTAFGFTYLENFLGLGTVIIDPAVEAKKPQATVKENFNGVYVPASGDVGTTFGLTADSTGMVGMKHFLVDGKASIDTLLMTGVTLYAEDLTGVFKGEIGLGE